MVGRLYISRRLPFLQWALRRTSACGVDGPWERLKERGGPRGRAHQAHSSFPTRPQSIVWEPGLQGPLPPRQPAAEAGDADTASSLCSAHSSVCQAGRRPAPLSASPPTPNPAPNKAPFRQSRCVRGRVETGDSYPSEAWAGPARSSSLPGRDGPAEASRALIPPQASPGLPAR